MMLLIINILLIIVAETVPHSLPKYFPRCDLNDAELNVCLGRAANALRPYITKGIEEIKFPSIDPLVVSRIDVNQESNLVNYTVKMWNFTVQALDNYDFTEFRYDPKTLTFNGSMEVDSMVFTSIYDIKGNWLSIPLEGKGMGRVNLGGVNGTFEVKGKMVKRNGIDHYKPISTIVRIKLDDVNYNFGSLFGGNEELGRLTNNLINQNSKVITEAVTPVLEQMTEKGLMYLMKALMKEVSYNELFLSSDKN